MWVGGGKKIYRYAWETKLGSSIANLFYTYITQYCCNWREFRSQSIITDEKYQPDSVETDSLICSSGRQSVIMDWKKINLAFPLGLQKHIVSNLHEFVTEMSILIIDLWFI